MGISSSAVSRVIPVLMSISVSLAPGCDGDADEGRGSTTAAATIPPIAVSASVGTLPGTFSVGPDGSANYSIPLEVPSGRAGIEPALAMSYSSNAGRGLLGRGWSINMSSQIAPCSSSWRRDGEVRPPQLTGTAKDSYCLDGAPLVCAVVDATGRCPTTTMEFRTEPDSAALIVPTRDSAGSIRSWTVKSKDGRIIQYGATTDSRIEALVTARTGDATCAAKPQVLAWLQSGVEDRVGNYMSYVYTFSPGSLTAHSFCPEDPSAPPPPQVEWVLDRIVYTGSKAANKAPNRTVKFNYVSSPEPRKSFFRGVVFAATQRLKSIRMYAPKADGGSGDPALADRVRSYDFAYEDEPPISKPRPRLASVTLCDLNGSACLPPTKFTYSDANPTFTSSAFTIDIRDPDMFFTTDITGDGRDDLVYMSFSACAKRDSSGSCVADQQIAIRTGTPTGLSEPTFSAFPQKHNADGTLKKLVPFDNDRDARTDLIGTYERTFCVAPNTTCSSTATPISCDPTDLAQTKCTVNRTYLFAATAASPGFAAGTCVKGVACDAIKEVQTFSDGNGDLLGDHFETSIVQTGAEVTPPWQQTWSVRLSVGTSPTSTGLASRALTNSTPWLALSRCNGAATCDRVRPELAKLQDVDGDGLTDLLLPFVANPGTSTQFLRYDVLQLRGSKVEVARSNLENRATWSYNSELQSTEYSDDDLQCSVFADINADGLPDIISLLPGLPLRFNDGQGFRPWERGLLPAFSGMGGCDHADIRGSEVRVVDYNQDGLLDLLLLGAVSSLTTQPARVLQNTRCTVGEVGCSSTGHKFVSLDLPFSVTTKYEWSWEAKQKSTLDVNGDGLFDIVQVRDGADSGMCAAGTNCLEVLVQAVPAMNPPVSKYFDKLVSISDGFGSTARSIKYAALTSTPYTLPSSCAYPERCLSAQHLVVTEELVPDATSTAAAPSPGLSMQLARTYRYEGSIADSWGAWLGFRTVTTTDARTGTNTRITYNRKSETIAGASCRVGPFDICRYAHAGQPVEELTWTPIRLEPNGPVTNIRATRVLTAYSVKTSSASTRFFFSYAPKQFVEEYEFLPTWTPAAVPFSDTAANTPGSGDATNDPLLAYSSSNLLGRTATTTTVDELGNATQVIVDRGSGLAVTTTVRTITNDLTNWLIGLVTLEETTSAQSGRQVTRTTRYVHESDGTGRVRDIVREPNAVSDGLRRCMRVAARDAVGNATKIEETPSAGSDPCAPTLDTRSTVTEYLSATGTGDGIFARAITDAVGNRMERTYHPGLGVLRFEQDPAGLATTYGYDGFGRLRQTTQADGITATITHSSSRLDALACPVAFCITTQTNAGDFSQVSSDALGQAVRTITRSAESAGSRRVFADAEFDALGRLTAQKRPYFEGDNQLYLASYTYDALNRPRRTCALSADASVPSTNRPAASTSYSACTRYDYTRRETNVYEEAGTASGVLRSFKDTNAAGQLITTAIYPNGAPVTTRYDYGPFDTLLSVTNPKNQAPVTMQHDVLGRRTRLFDRDLGTATDVLGPFSRKTSYNAFDEVSREEDAKGQVTTLVYDKLGRMKTRSASDGTDTFTWDTALKGRLAKQSRGTVSTSYTYDATTGLLTNEAWTIDSANYDYSFSYFTAADGAPGRLKTLTYPIANGSRFMLGHSYDANGNLRELRDVTNALATRSIWKPTLMDAESRIREEALGNGLLTQTTFNPGTGRLIRIRSGTALVPGSIHDMEYRYTAHGLLTARTDYRNSMTNAAMQRSEDFTYDGANRLRTATVAGRTPPKFTYTYDDLGNLLSADDQGACANYIYGDGTAAGSHQLVAMTCYGGATRIAYDGNGNEISTTAPDFREQDWTSFNKPLEVRSRHGRMRYTYDAAHRRVKKERVSGALSSMTSPQLPAANDTLSGVWDTTLFIGDLFERRTVTDALSTTSRIENVHYIRAAGRPIAELIISSTSTPAWRYLHKDYQGTVERSTDASGTLKEITSFDAWGNRRSPDWYGLGPTYTQDTRLGYTGHSHDDEFAGNGFGVIDMGGRTYDAFFKRFTSPDPIVQDPTYGPSWNRYSYVFNSPVNNTDPTGYITNAGFEQMNAAWYGVSGLVDNMTASGQDRLTWVKLTKDGQVVFYAMGPWAVAAAGAFKDNRQWATAFSDWIASMDTVDNQSSAAMVVRWAFAGGEWETWSDVDWAKDRARWELDRQPKGLLREVADSLCHNVNLAGCGDVWNRRIELEFEGATQDEARNRALIEHIVPIVLGGMRTRGSAPFKIRVKELGNPGLGRGKVPLVQRDPLRLAPTWLKRLLPGRCYLCEAKLPLSETIAHHVNRWADGGKTILKNIVGLCDWCHRGIHQ
jgi:RHS repeat-associated protein